MYNCCSCDRGRVMRNFRFDTICNITHDPQKPQRLCLWTHHRQVSCDHQLLTKVTSINGNRVSTRQYQQLPPVRLAILTEFE